jgi:hypothetical protein
VPAQPYRTCVTATATGPAEVITMSGTDPAGSAQTFTFEATRGEHGTLFIGSGARPRLLGPTGQAVAGEAPAPGGD